MPQSPATEGNGTACLLSAFSLVVALGVAVVGVKALLDGYYQIAVLALIATLGILTHAVARFLVFRSHQ